MTVPPPRGRPRKTHPPTFTPSRPGRNSPSVRNSPSRQRWLTAKALADHRAVSITLPRINTRELTDADLGLSGGDAAQARAEQALRHAANHGLREAEAISGMRVYIPDDALSVIPVLPNEPYERAVLRELHRRTGLPPVAGL